MNYLGDILREYPALAIFLTVGLGFLIGKLKYKAFSLGSVTSSLLVGILVGQFGISISGEIKTVFFMMFLFSIGYSVGPGFFRSLRGVGMKQAIFAVAMSFCCFAVTVGVAKFMGYSPGETVGLFSGSQTCSSLIGVGSEAIENGIGSAAEKLRELNLVPICYAVTYVYGTLGTIIILAMLGPRLLGGLDKVKQQVAELQKEYSHSPWRDDPAYISAMHEVAFRAYNVTSLRFANGMTVKQTESMLLAEGVRLYVDRVHRPGRQDVLASPSCMIRPGDTIVLSGRVEEMVKASPLIGHEIVDAEVLNYPVKQVPVLLRNRDLSGKNVCYLSSRKYMHGVLIKEIKRAGAIIEFSDSTELRPGDTLTLVGAKKMVDRAAGRLGNIDRPSIHTDIMFLCLAIFIGGVIGTITVRFGSVPVNFGTGGGALIAGLMFGWLRSRRPTYGHIPRSVLWLMNQMGLNVFIAVVGITSGPTFVAGIKTVGWALPIAGMVATTIPLLIGIWMGHKIFKFNPAFILGCCAGTRTCTASLGAVQDALGSTLPTIGYTITYAVSNVLLIIWGLLAVLLV
ncbi:MAG: aspartate-alanine antiporter [Paramuribaculum sp.]|nr:aspartate-alanine antiporter [Paramuribaculum sp.]